MDKIKTKYLDFDHPPRVKTLVIFDIFLVCAVLIIYSLVQHVIPSHFFTSLVSNLTIHDTATTSEPLPAVSIVIPSPSPTAQNPDAVSLDVKFKDKFSDSVIIASNHYKSPNVSVTISEYSSGEDLTIQHWYVADIYLSNIHCLQTYLHDGLNMEVGRDIRSLSKAAGSVISINGDYALTTSSGVVIRNGEVIREKPAEAEICVLYSDGVMECYSPSEYDSESVLSRGAWQAWTFGPSLLDKSGKAIHDFSSYYGSVLENNPRTVLGYYEPGHYCFVLIDGRQPGYAVGCDMNATADLMESLGCSVAFNLDGGRSSQMTFGTEYVNIPYKSGRYVGDIVFIKDIFLED